MFNSSSLVFALIILAVYNFATGGFDLQSTLLMLPGLIIALTLHEFAHAYAAYKLGDDTPKYQNRLNVNPISHMDLGGTLCLLFAGFGWGKPVQINPTNFKNPVKDEAKVALAGPLMNLFLSVIFAIIFAILNVIIIKTNSYERLNNGYIELSVTWQSILTMVSYGMILNIGLGLFNLLPFPPLDGSKILRAILRGKAREFLYRLEAYSGIIIIILFATHAASYILEPLSNSILNGLLNLINLIVGSAL